MQRPLQNIRVVDQGTFITGPCAAMMLADLGADVIKVESPGTGDPFRAFKGGLYSAHFQAYNRNKRSIALDLRAPQDLEIFDGLIRGADVYIQNFRPGAAGRMGAGYERLHQINPRLVYGSISGFGADGPYAGRPSYDSVAQALSGFLSVMVDPANPRFHGPPIADAITGIYTAYGILGALVARGSSGQGSLVEVSMLEAMMHFAIEPFANYFSLGVPPSSVDRPAVAQAFILKSKDQKLLAAHLSSVEKFWLNLTAALEAESLREDPRFNERLQRIAHHEALSHELNLRFAARNLSDWMERLAASDVPFAPVHTMDTAAEDPQVVHLGLIVPVENPPEGATRGVRPAVNFDGFRPISVQAPPLVDEHGASIRSSLSSGKGWPAPARKRAAET